MKHGTIRQLLILGIGAVLCAFVLLGAGWMVSIAHLGEMKTRLFTDAQSLQHAQTLEMNVLSLARNRKKELSDDEALRLLTELKNGVTSPEEERIVAALERRYSEWSAAPQTATMNGLLEAIRNHRHLNTQQMQQTMQTGNLLEARVRLWTPVLIALAAVALGVGAWKLWAKIFRPTLALAECAESFGSGDLAARAPVLGKDEMNDLCRTFNSMADAIRDRESDRLTFVATVAHDLKNPLVIVGGAAHLLQTKKVPPDQQDEWLGRILRNSRQMESMVTGLLDGVQSLTGRLHLEREEVDLLQLCTDVVRDWSAVAKPQGHVLRCEGNDNCLVRGDRKRLERVLINLLSNAVKYSPDGSEIVVSIWKQGTSVRLAVTDQGEGMTPEDAERVFQPFTRLEHTRSMASGTGLGLVSVKKIVEAHGGTVRLRSERGNGTTVEVWLKALEGEGAQRIFHNPIGNNRKEPQ
jgi:signal transduction histidine kinase